MACSDPGGRECIGMCSDVLTLRSSSQQFCHLFGDRFMGFLPFQLLALYSDVVSNELVAVGVTCGLSEPSVTTFAVRG